MRQHGKSAATETFLNLFGKNLERDVVVVAEVGVNHEGDVNAASRILAGAAGAGADAVKFQSYTPNRFISSKDPERLARVTRFGLDVAAHRRLAKEAAALGVQFFSTPVTEDWVPLLAELGSAIKIASGDLTFEPLIRAAAQTGKPVIISTGIGTVAEIDAAVGWVRDEVGSAALAQRLVLMHCVSAYPAPIAEANVRSVPFLRERYGLEVGYSNHVIGPEAALAAVALGASVVEVHVTDRKEGREFRDHALSFEPADLKNLVTAVRAVRQSLGTFDKQPQPSEAGNRDAIRKGVVAARDVAANVPLTRDDLMYARPATEFAASQLSTLVGRKLRQAVRMGEPIARSNVQ